MNEPVPELPGWKLRLLQRIQDSSAQHRQILLGDVSSVEPGGRGEHDSIQSWRARLRALDADRSELETRAAAAGVPDSAIEQARAAGQSGLSSTSSGAGNGSDRLREFVVDGVAADIWQLEHMAAIAAERRFGRGPGRLNHHRDPGEVEQFGRNMAALWNRANQTAHAIGLSAAERAQLWGRDQQGWQQLVGLTVATYDDAELVERWRVYAVPGLEREARRDTSILAAGIDASREPGQAPPLPHLLIERAVEAVSTPRGGQVETGEDISDVIEAAVSGSRAPGIHASSPGDIGSYPVSEASRSQDPGVAL